MGSMEQHGPHLPLGTDVHTAQGLAHRVAERRRAMIAPPIFYSARSRPKSGVGRSFVGSIGMPTATLTATMRAVFSESFWQGITRIVLINGHFENAHPATAHRFRPP
jgi:creatinine amidohydrolase